MESDPADRALFNGLGEGFLRGGSPVVGRVVQLNEQLVAGEKGCIDPVCIRYVVDGEVIGSRLFCQPLLGGVDKWLVDAAFLGDCDDPEPRLMRVFCPHRVRKDGRDDQKKYGNGLLTEPHGSLSFRPEDVPLELQPDAQTRELCCERENDARKKSGAKRPNKSLIEVRVEPREPGERYKEEPIVRQQISEQGISTGGPNKAGP